jgi:hypothetical protein
MLVNLLRQVNDLPSSRLEMESEMAKFIVRSEPPTDPRLAVPAVDAVDALQVARALMRHGISIVYISDGDGKQYDLAALERLAELGEGDAS